MPVYFDGDHAWVYPSHVSSSLPPDFHKKAMDYFAKQVAAENAGVTHAIFAEGVKTGTMDFTCPRCSSYKIIRGARRKKAFALYVIFYCHGPSFLGAFMGVGAGQ